MKNWTYKNFTIHQFETLDSTNVKAFEMAASRQIFADEIILADAQTAGRGRLQRVWDSPKGNLYFSLVLQPQGFVAEISFVAIVALRQAISDLLSVLELNVQNKWPNDLLINEKKVAGILLESKFNQKNCEFVILGIGVNIDSSPDKAIFPATSLKNFNIAITSEILLQKFLDKFEILYQNWLSFGFAGTRAIWLKSAYKFGEKILIKLGDELIEGIFQDLDIDGSLILLTKDGVKKIAAADILLGA